MATKKSDILTETYIVARYFPQGNIVGRFPANVARAYTQSKSLLLAFLIALFRVAACLSFKASTGAQPFKWK